MNTKGIVTVRASKSGTVSGPLYRVGSEAVDIETLMRLQRELTLARRGITNRYAPYPQGV